MLNFTECNDIVVCVTPKDYRGTEEDFIKTILGSIRNTHKNIATVVKKVCASSKLVYFIEWSSAIVENMSEVDEIIRTYDEDDDIMWHFEMNLLARTKIQLNIWIGEVVKNVSDAMSDIEIFKTIHIPGDGYELVEGYGNQILRKCDNANGKLPSFYTVIKGGQN